MHKAKKNFEKKSTHETTQTITTLIKFKEKRERTGTIDRERKNKKIHVIDQENKNCLDLSLFLY